MSRKDFPLLPEEPGSRIVRGAEKRALGTPGRIKGLLSCMAILTVATGRHHAAARRMESNVCNYIYITVYLDRMNLRVHDILRRTLL